MTVNGTKALNSTTFGFPLDLTALIARERGYQVDEDGFDAQMAKQKERSRAAAVSATDDWQIIKQDDEEEFVGYDLLSTPVSITKYRKVSSKKRENYSIGINIYPFYPESGGQVGDKGYLEAPNGAIHYIIDTKKENDLILHYSKTLPIDLHAKFNAEVDQSQRFKTL